jgi:biopolymer transport protein ExbD
MWKRKRKAGEGSDGPVSDINVTPMVDVMLVILIIFMVITPLITKGVSVELYKADNPISMENADKEDAITVAVTRDGKPYMAGKVVSKNDIASQVKTLMEGKLEKTVFIKCDNRARFEALTDVIDSLREGGVDQLGLLTDRTQAKKPAGAPAGSM